MFLVCGKLSRRFFKGKKRNIFLTCKKSREKLLQQ
jgi:hypothetical protein